VSARGRVSAARALFASPAGGLILMLLATAVFSVMHALVRHLSGALHPFEIAFFRNLFGLLAVLPLLVRAGRAGLRTRQPGLQLVRGGLAIVAMLSWFYALAIVPLAEATALSFTSALFGSLGAVLFLGERMGVRRWGAVAAGFAGALLILRPGLAAVSPGSLVVLLSALAWGSALVVVKRLARTDTTVTIVVYMSIMTTLLAALPAAFVWRTPSLIELGWLGLMGVLATIGTLATTQALRLADATAVMPLDFTRLVWASVLGYLLFSEVPDGWTWAGGVLIAASATYIAVRESRRRRAALAPPCTPAVAAPPESPR